MINWNRIQCGFLLVVVMVTTPSLANRNPNNFKAAILIVDIQDCFLQGGSLAVGNANDVIPVINRIHEQYKELFSLVVFTQDWHPQGHVSFASSHPGKQVYDVIRLTYLANGSLCLPVVDPVTFKRHFPMAVTCHKDDAQQTFDQVMWPDHCLQNVSTGPTSSRLSDQIQVHPRDIIIQKGNNLEVDSYSAFYDNGRFDQTELHQLLTRHGITHLFVTGLALDYCVYYTSMDAHSLGFQVYAVLDAAQGVSPDTIAKAKTKMADSGVHLITSYEIPEVHRATFGPNSATPSVQLNAVTLVVKLVLLHAFFSASGLLASSFPWKPRIE